MYKQKKFSSLPYVPINWQGDFSLWFLLNKKKPQGFLQKEKTEQKTGHTICPVYTVLVREVQKEDESITVIHIMVLLGPACFLETIACPLCNALSAFSTRLAIISGPDIVWIHGV